MFRSLNTYPRLADEIIEGNPDLVTDAELEDAAIPILDRLYSLELKAGIARYGELKPRRATTAVSYAAHAATAGAVEQLLVDLDALSLASSATSIAALPVQLPMMPRLIASSTKWRGVRSAREPG
jgi:hypothetical protein